MKIRAHCPVVVITTSGVFSVMPSLVRCVSRYEVGLESFDAITQAEAVVGEEDEEDEEDVVEVMLCVKFNLGKQTIKQTKKREL